MTRPLKPNSSRNNSVTIRRETVAGVGFDSKHGYQAVADHHAVNVVYELAKHGQLILIKLFSSAIYPGQLIMCIGSCSGVTGKMFTAAGDPLPPHCFIERTCVSNNLIDAFPVAPAAQRVLGVIVKGNVQHGTKIEIEPEKAQQTSSDIAVSPD